MVMPSAPVKEDPLVFWTYLFVVFSRIFFLCVSFGLMCLYVKDASSDVISILSYLNLLS